MLSGAVRGRRHGGAVRNGKMDGGARCARRGGDKMKNLTCTLACCCFWNRLVRFHPSTICFVLKILDEDSN